MAGLKKAYLEITNVCNLRCEFCPGTRRKQGFLSPEGFEVLAGKLRPYVDYIYLHLMGEPLLHPQLSQLLDVAASRIAALGITLDDTDVGDMQLQVDYAAWMFKRRNASVTVMPRWLDLDLKNRLVAEKGR